MRKRSIKDILTSPLLMTIYTVILLFVFLLFRFKTSEGIVVNSFEEKNNSFGAASMIFSEVIKKQI